MGLAHPVLHRGRSGRGGDVSAPLVGGDRFGGDDASQGSRFDDGLADITSGLC